MKQIKYFIGSLLLCLSVFLFIRCADTDDGSYVSPITISEKTNGDWHLLSITQIDETAKKAGLNPSEISLTDQFEFTTFGITLNVDSDGNPTSYAVSGNAPAIFNAQGYWALDTDFPQTNGTPPTILLYGDAAKTQQAGKLNITSMPGATPEMELKLTRTFNSVPFVSYQIKLTKTN
ncbi:MAG: DUF5004 domain-containing protein [Prevotellaceae bacterium]|jgi:hypothetical protein|nr:DUF5004 domain-containing protein [Prevotellaceae bacterium]